MRQEINKITRNDGSKLFYIDGPTQKIEGPDHVFPSKFNNRVFKGQLHNPIGPALYLKTGEQYYYMNGLLHRTDGPAIVYQDTEYWFQNGQIHRDYTNIEEDGNPTVKKEDGTLIWYQHDKVHRIGEPAIFRPNGSKEYYQNGLLHSPDNDTPAIIHNGKEEFYQNGKLHRDNDLPAQISKYEEIWYQHGQIHRDNAPARIGNDNGQEEWYQDGWTHRIDGPATYYKKKDGSISSKYYYIKGDMQITPVAIWTRMLKNHIKSKIKSRK